MESKLDISRVIKTLSKSEKKVFFCAMTRMTYVEIANELGVSENAIRFHMGNICRITNKRSRLDLITSFIDQNLIHQIIEMQNQINDLQTRFDNFSRLDNYYLPAGRK